MRHDPVAGALIIILRSLKTHGMAQTVGELAQQGALPYGAAIPALSQLLKAQNAERKVRSTAYQLKGAHFPAYRDLAGFDFANSGVNKPLVRWLHGCDFNEPADKAGLAGGPGTGGAAKVPPMHSAGGMLRRGDRCHRRTGRTGH